MHEKGIKHLTSLLYYPRSISPSQQAELIRWSLIAIEVIAIPPRLGSFPLILPSDACNILMELVAHLKHPLEMVLGHDNDHLWTIIRVFFNLELRKRDGCLERIANISSIELHLALLRRLQDPLLCVERYLDLPGALSRQLLKEPVPDPFTRLSVESVVPDSYVDP